MITQLTQVKFYQKKATFERTLRRVPTTCVLHIAVPRDTPSESTEESEFRKFTGERERDIHSYTLKCLYKRDFSPAERAKYGYEEDISGVVYISPTELKSLTGSERLDKRAVTVTFAGNDYTASNVIYRGPLYNTCLAIEIPLVEPHNI